ncbi:MAG TPA: O-antigen ligase family protein [Ardenticatenaceae bacterium]|nr:O-antigen ligase family protein [Ardenticatenaceae bacterium]
MASTVSSYRSDWNPLIFVGLALLGGALAAMLALGVSIVKIVGAVAILGIFAAAAYRLEWGLIGLVFLTYTRATDVAVKQYDTPSITQPLIGLLVLVVLARWHFKGERPSGWQRGALLLAGYGMARFASLLFADYFGGALYALTEYAKDAIIAIIVTVLLYRGVTLRRVSWALVAAGTFLGTIAVIQYVTGAFENSFGGFGEAQISHIIGVTNDYRIGGPDLHPNAYAQIMIPLVALALDRLLHERSRALRLLAGWGLLASMLTIVFTFSRGALVAMAMMLGLWFLRRPPPPRQLALAVLLLVPLIRVLPPTYTSRMATLLEIVPVITGDSADGVTAEVSFRGRSSEVMVAFQMFADRPFLGVGLGNYPVHYQTYSRQIGLDPRRENRSPHSLLPQIAAETGIVGLATFSILLWGVFSGLWRAEKALTRIGRWDYAGIASALALGILGYLFASLFLHMVYPRFFWLLIGVALAVPQVAKYELALAGESRRGKR